MVIFPWHESSIFSKCWVFPVVKRPHRHLSAYTMDKYRSERVGLALLDRCRQIRWTPAPPYKLKWDNHDDLHDFHVVLSCDLKFVLLDIFLAAARIFSLFGKVGASVRLQVLVPSSCEIAVEVPQLAGKWNPLAETVVESTLKLEREFYKREQTRLHVA